MNMTKTFADFCRDKAEVQREIYEQTHAPTYDQLVRLYLSVEGMYDTAERPAVFASR